MGFWKNVKERWREATYVPSPREWADFNRRSGRYDLTVPDMDVRDDRLSAFDKVALELAMHRPTVIDATGTAPPGSREYRRRLDLVLEWARKQPAGSEALNAIREGTIGITWNTDVTEPVLYEFGRQERFVRAEELRDAKALIAAKAPEEGQEAADETAANVDVEDEENDANAGCEDEAYEEAFEDDADEDDKEDENQR